VSRRCSYLLLQPRNSDGRLDRTTTKRERLKEYAGVLSLPNITDAEEHAIDEAGSKLHRRAWVSSSSGSLKKLSWKLSFLFTAPLD
jgi:hypothetical protein